MSISCGGCRLEYAGGRGLSGLAAVVPRPGQSAATCACSARCVRFHRHAHALLEPTRRHRDAARVPGRAAASRATSSRTSSRRWSPRSGRPRPTRTGDYPARYLFVVPGQPRDAQRHRLAAVVHGRRRVGALRRAGGEGPDRGVDLDTGARVDPHRRRASTCATTPTRSSHFDGAVLATHPRPGAAACSPPRLPPSATLLGAIGYTVEPDACCTPTRRCCRGPRGRRRRGTTRCRLRRGADRGAGELQHEPAAAPGRPGDLRGHAQRLDSRSHPSRVIDRMELRAPRLHQRLGRGARHGCPSSTTASSPSPARTTAGASTRTAAAPASRPRRAWA